MATYETLNQICQTLARWLNGSEPSNPGWSPEIWPTFQRVSQVHGVAPLLYTKLRQAAWLEPDMKTWLAEQYDFNGQRLAKMHGELKEILGLFNENNIPLIPLKGSILSTLYYEEPGLRPMADLDLLIRPQAIETSLKLLAQLGYQQERMNWKHITLVKPDNRLVVSRQVEHPYNPREIDLHFACREMFGGPAINLTEMIWANTRQCNLLGEPALVMTPDVLWLHSLVHTSNNIWSGGGRLIYLVDLAHLTPHLENPLVALNSADARFTYFALLWLKKYFPGSLDASPLEFCQARLSASFNDWVNSFDLVNSSHLNPRPATPHLLKVLRFYEGRPQDIWQALRFIFLPTIQQLSLTHPKSAKLWWLIYLLLPLFWLNHVITNLGLIYGLIRSQGATQV